MGSPGLARRVKLCRTMKPIESTQLPRRTLHRPGQLHCAEPTDLASANVHTAMRLASVNYRARDVDLVRSEPLSIPDTGRTTVNRLSCFFNSRSGKKKLCKVFCTLNNRTRPSLSERLFFSMSYSCPRDRLGFTHIVRAMYRNDNSK